MTDDPTKPIETPVETPAAGAAVASAPQAEAAATPPAPPAEAATAPLMAATTPAVAPSPSRTRWVIAIGVAALAIAVTIGAVLLFGQQPAPSALQYVPGDAAVVAEIRLDLPGDQMQKLGNLLAHFPGFGDQSTLNAKLDEALTRFVAMASDGKADYAADIKPWVNGPLFIGARNPSADVASEGPKDVVISATTNGAADCARAFKDQTITHETYKSLDLFLAGDMACVVDGRQALLGDPATVRLAIDARSAGSGMDRSASYKAARTALGGDRLVTVYMDGESLRKLLPESTQLPVPELQGLMGELPSWLMAGLRAEDDALVLDYVAAPVPASTAGPSLLPIPAAHASVITSMVPGDTLVYIEAQGAGVSLQNLLTQLKQIPDLASALQVLDGLGGAGELVGWIDDVGVSLSMRGTTPDGAILLVAKDETSAATRVASLKTLIGLMGTTEGVEVTNSTIGGVAVTTVTITDLGSLIPPGTIPGTDVPATGPVSFSLAARGKAMIVTTGEAAMTAILNTAAGSSLADNAAFKHAATRGITNALTTVYIGVGATLDLVTGLLPAEELAAFRKDAAPYVEPVEAFLLQASSDTAGNRSRMVITVTQP